MLTDASVRVEYIPAHKYLGVYGKSSTTNGEIWAGHDCDETTDIVQNMAIYADAIITAHTAGWIENGKTYFYGLGLPLDYNGEIPEGFKLRELPGSYYLVFSHPPFEYPKNNGEVMRIVEEKAWNFDPKSMGFEWNENECQDYQRHYPEGLGYQVLRSVRRINK